MGSLSSALEETETLIELVSGSRDGMRLRAIAPSEQERLGIRCLSAELKGSPDDH